MENRDLSSTTRELRHARRPTAETGMEDFPVHTEQKLIVKTDGKTIAESTQSENRRRACGALERGRGSSRRRPLVAISSNNIPNGSSLPFGRPNRRVLICGRTY